MPSFLPQYTAEVLVGAERLGLPTEAIEGQHAQSPGPFTQWVGTDMRFQKGQRRAGLAEGEFGVHQVLDGIEAGLIEPAGLESGELPVCQVTERRAGEQVEGEAERLGDPRRLGQRRPGFVDEVREPPGVHLIRSDLEDVTAVPAPQRCFVLPNG